MKLSMIFGLRKWNNDMKHLLIFLAFALSAAGAYAQDAELSALSETVKALRNGGATAFDNAVGKLAKDAAWTPMNELKASDPSAECRASDRVPGFKLNKLLAKAEQAQRFETSTGNMLNGENPLYSYSLYERALKPGKTASYALRSRFGEQTFIFIPYDKDAAFDIEISCGDVSFEKTRYNDGSVRLCGKAAEGKAVAIKITNKDSANRSFVLLNHNPRK